MHRFSVSKTKNYKHSGFSKTLSTASPMIFRTTHLILFLIFYTDATVILGQQYVATVRQFGPENGLSDRSVKAIFQDKRGLIWLGTRTGLNRFDGYSFQLYDQKNAGLGLSDIQSIAEDGNGWLWLTGPEGPSNTWLLHPYEKTASTFEQYFAASAPCKPSDIQPEGYCSAPDGSIWFALNSRPALVRYQPKNGWQVFEFAQYRQVSIFAVSGKNTLWCTVDNTDVVELSSEATILNHHPNKAPVQVRSKERVLKNGFFYTVGKGEMDAPRIYFVDKYGQQKELPSKHFRKLAPSIPQTMCALGESGLVWANNKLLHPSKGVLLDLSEQIPSYYNYGLRSFLEDSEGRFWIGTEFGVAQVEIQENKFGHYFAPSKKTADPANACRGLAIVGDRLFVQVERKGVFWQDLKKAKRHARFGPKILQAEVLRCTKTGREGCMQALPGKFDAMTLSPGRQKNGRCFLGLRSGLFMKMKMACFGSGQKRGCFF